MPPKLSRDQWEQLDAQFSRLPEQNDGLAEPGEHLILMALLNTLGYSPHSREETIEIAQRLLDEGHQEP